MRRALSVIPLNAGDRLDIRIGAVRKRLNEAVVRMLAYNGSISGPTLHVNQGSEITVQVTNNGDIRRPFTGTDFDWRTATTGSRTKHRPPSR